MKALVFVLVLANLLFYAFSTGLIGTADVDEGVRLAQQVQPERINIVARGEPPAPAVVPAAVTEPESAPALLASGGICTHQPLPSAPVASRNAV